MVWAAPALAATTLCLGVCTDLVKATAAALILGAVLSSAEQPRLGELLVCDLEPGTIPASHPNILEQLKLCPALTGAQRDALNALLLSGDTEHGDPSSWDSQTLQDLGPLVLALNQTTLSLVAEAAREDFRRSIAAAYITQDHSQREKSLMLLRALAAASAASRPRLKRSEARCESKPITASNIDDTVPFLSLEDLDLCLSSEVLIKNLEDVLVQPLISDALQVLKKKVDEYFPSGIPEEQLGRLGVLSRLYTEQEISQWPVKSSDTLWALLSPSGGTWSDSQVQQLLSRFLALGGSLTGPLLQEIGGKHLCELQEEQIQKIPAGAIGTAGQLNISSCSQSKKEQLYGKAREAFASLAGTPGPYYCRIRPYLGGAPAEDLKDLASSGVINMDLDTFLSLNPQEFQKLSVTDVKNLLGENLPELKEAEQEPLVVSWVQRQRQRELDCVLGIGLQGGLPEPAGTASPAGPTSMVTATTPVPTTPATVTSMVTATTPVPTTPASVTSMVTTSAGPTTPATVTSMVTTPVPTTPASVTSMVPVTTSATVTSMVTTSAGPTTPASVTTPVPTTLTSVTSVVTTPVPTTPDTVTSMATVPTSPHPATSDNVTPVSTTLPTVPSTSASVTSMATVPTPTSLPAVPTPPHPPASVTVPTPTAISSHSTPEPSTVPPQPPTLSPTPPDTHTHTGGPPVPSVTPTATSTARPALTTAAPCSTHQAATTDRATSPAVTSLATSSPSATPVPAATSGATTTAGVGTNLAGSTHSTATPVPNPTSTATVTPVPNPTSTATVTSVPKPSSVPTVTSVPKPSSVPTVTPVPNASSVPTVTPVPNASSVPTVTTVPKPCSVATATHSTVPNPSSSPTVTTVPNPSSTAIVPTVPNPSSSPTVTPVPNATSAPTATHTAVTPVPNLTSVPTATPVPHSPSAPGAAPTPTPIPGSTRTSPGSSPAVPCQPSPSPSSAPRPPSPSSTTSPSPASVPEPPPTSNGIINLQPPEPGSGSRLCSCLVPLLAATVGKFLLWGLL